MLDLHALGAELRRPLVVGAVGGRLLHVLQLGGAALELLDLVGHAGHLEPQLGSRLVDEVDGLVRQLTPGDVALAEAHGGLHRAVVDGHVVVRLIPRPEGFEHEDGVLLRRLLHPHGVEAALQGRVLFDVLPVLVGGGRAYDLQLSASQGGLHHVGGVNGTLGAASANDGVNLVDEEDDRAPGGHDLVHDRLEPLLELAAELGAGDQARHVEPQDPLVLEGVRHASRGDGLGEALDDRRLADASLAQQHRVVLGAARERLDRLTHHALAGHDGVEPPLAGELRQVPAELLQGAVPVLGVGVGDSL